MSQESSNVIGNSQWSELVVRRHHQFLLDHMDPDFGLLVQLVAIDALSYKQRDIVKAEKTVDERNCKLLSIIQSENKCDGLIYALRSSNQTHIIKYLEADGKDSFDNDWPLREREKKILRANFPRLIELIDSTQLVDELYSQEVINKSQQEFIQGEKTSSKQNEAFIDILRRRSMRDYNRTIAALQKTKQPHIAKLLEEGGAIVGLHVNTDAATEAEGQLADEITEMIVSRPLEECGRILELVQFKVIAAKKGQSVVLYVYLQSNKQLDQLKTSLKFGSLNYSVQRFFNAITLVFKQISVSSVTVAKSELSRVESFLSGLNNEDIKDRVRRNFSTLFTNLDADRLSDYLIQGSIISTEQYYRIKVQSTTKQERCRELLLQLIMMDIPNTWIVFMEALSQNAEWKWIEDLINGYETPTAVSHKTEGFSELKLNKKEMNIIKPKTRDKGLPCGLTTLQDALFVIFDGDPVVEIYNLSNLSFRCYVEVPKLLDPGDIKSCEKTNRLFIVDWKEASESKEILILDPVGSVTKRWTTEPGECRLSVSMDSTLVATNHDQHKIIEYEVDGKRYWESVKKISLEASAPNPWHAVKLMGGLFAVCHGKVVPDRKAPRDSGVCIVNDVGHLLKAYGEQFKHPASLELRPDGSIIVVYQRDKGVCQIDPSIERKSTMLLPSDLQSHDSRIWRSFAIEKKKGEKNERFFLVDCGSKEDIGIWHDGRILVFDVIQQ